MGWRSGDWIRIGENVGIKKQPIAAYQLIGLKSNIVLHESRFGSIRQKLCSIY